MSGFNVAELMPFYLDETDEQSPPERRPAALEQDPADAKALQEAFRILPQHQGLVRHHGVEPVNKLTHHLESLYDQLRSGKRMLDRRHARPDLPLPGRAARLSPRPPCQAARAKWTCRDRSQRWSNLARGRPTRLRRRRRPSHSAPTAARDRGSTRVRRLAVVVTFQANLPLADMKARLVLNRLSTKARILSTDPPVEQLEEIETLTSFTVVLTTETDSAELRSLADVEGVEEIRFEESTRRARRLRGPAVVRKRPIGRGAAPMQLGRSRPEPTPAPRCREPAAGAAAIRARRRAERRRSLPAESRRSPRRSASTATGSTT